MDRAFSVFLVMNYEKASINTLAKACGLTKTGIVYYFPHKLELFMAVADKYVLQLQKPTRKFSPPSGTLAEFIGQYVEGVSKTMKYIIEHVNRSGQSNNCCPNFYYFHFIFQVRMYYPNVQEKIDQLFRQNMKLWTGVIQKAKDSGEIKAETDVHKAAALFHQTFYGLSFEQSFLNGLDTDQLADSFRHIYSLLKA